MDNTTNSVIKIQAGNEYHVLVDDPQNLYNENMFFYPVYKKSALLLKEICNNNMNLSCNDGSVSNNIIMYCAERGGGKSSSMRSFANILNNFEDERDKTGFPELFESKMNDFRFSVLNVLDPTAICRKELFMRVILSRMFAAYESKLEAGENGSRYQDDKARHLLVSKFTDCYRLLDVIYQKGGEFSCEDDIEELTNLGDSCKLREKFGELVQQYLQILLGENTRKKDFLVIQIDDADLNPNMAFNIIEDIRKYCLVPNVVILMAVHMDQMRQVLNQHFVEDFEKLLNFSSSAGDENDIIRISDCQKMAARYIDKVMPAGHQIHLPDIDEYIRNRSSKLTIEYYNEDNENILNYTNSDGQRLTDYQEILLRLIYERTGIPLVKANGYLHNILPKTMRGLSHFLSFFYPLGSLKPDFNIAKIDTLLNYQNQSGTNPDEIKEAREQLETRRKNLDAFEQYFLKNWCPVRLTHEKRTAINDIASAALEQKIPSALKCLNKLYGKYSFCNTGRFEPPLSVLSYSYLLEVLRNICNNAHATDDAAKTYSFTYAVKLYFTLYFNRLIIQGIEEGGNFEQVLKLTNLETWEPQFENNDLFDFYSIMRFNMNYNVLRRMLRSQKSNTELNGITSINEIIKSTGILIVPTNSRNKYRYYPNRLMRGYDKYTNQICYNLGTHLLFYVCDKVPHGNDNNDLEKRCACRSSLFMLLLNWDIQRCAEKTIFDKECSSEEYNDRLLLINMMIQISNHLGKCLKYLCFSWDLSPSISEIGSNLNILHMSNMKICIRSVTETVRLIDDNIKNAAQNKPGIVPEWIGFISSQNAKYCNQLIEHIRYTSFLSPKIKEIIAKWDAVCSSILDENDTRPRRKKAPEENSGESYNNFKSCIESIRTNDIQKEIEEYFKNHKDIK